MAKENRSAGSASGNDAGGNLNADSEVVGSTKQPSIGGGTAKPIGGSGSENRNPDSDVGKAPEKRGRGRPAGSRNKTVIGSAEPSNASRLALKIDRAKLSNNIQAMHAGAAVLTNQPVFQIQPSEGDMLANALGDVFEHYGIDPFGKSSVWLGVVIAVGSVYGPRFMYLRQQRIAAREANNSPAMPATPTDAATPRTRPYNFGADQMAA